MPISAAVQGYMRTYPQDVDMYLSVFQPQTIWQGQIGSGIVTGSGQTTIPYINGTGSFSSIAPDMTLLVGSSVGDDDIGRLRLRLVSGTASALFPEEHNRPLSQNQYLTVQNYVELKPIFPRMIQDPNNPEEVIWYKNYDQLYTDQNEGMGTFVCMGPHRAVNLVSGTAVLNWAASGSDGMYNGNLTYTWKFQGGSPATSSSATPGNVTYSSGGHFVTELTITSSSGTSDTSYRYVSVYDTPGQGTNTPVLNWGINNIAVGRNEGGLTLSIRASQLVPVKAGYIVVIYGKSYYDGVAHSFGGNAARQDDIYFVGHVLDNTIQYDWEFGTVEFQIGSPTQYLKNKEPFGTVSLEGVPTPTKWYEHKNSTLYGKTATYHFLKWHSTLLKMTDFRWSNGDARIQYFDSEKTNIYDTLYNFIGQTFWGVLASDRQGLVYKDIDGKAIGVPSDYPDEMTITKEDWVGTPTITRARSKPTSWVELGGVSYNGTSASTPLLSAAPSLVASAEGKPVREQGLAVDSQLNLNKLSGARYSNDNAEFPIIEMEFPGPYWDLETVPMRAYRMSIQPEDTPENVAITGTYYINSMQYNYDEENKILSTKVTFHALTTGIVGVTIVIPPLPPGPLTQDPPLPPDPPTDPIDIPDWVYATGIVMLTQKGVYWTPGDDVYGVNSPSPTWYSLNGAVEVLDYFSDGFFINQIAADRYGHIVYCTAYNGRYLFYAPVDVTSLLNYGMQWQTANDFLADTFSYDQASVQDMAANPITGEVGYIVKAYPGTFGRVYFGYMNTIDGQAPEKIYTSNFETAVGGGLVLGDGVIFHSFFHNGSGARYSIDGGENWPLSAFSYPVGVGGIATVGTNFQVNGSQKVYSVVVDGLGGNIFNLFRSEDGGETWNHIYKFTDGTLKIAFDTDGVGIAQNNSTLLTSVDDGETWTTLIADTTITLPGGNGFKVLFGMGNGVWLGTTDKKFLVSFDGGSTWNDRTGNLIEVAAWNGADLQAMQLEVLL